MNSQGYLSGWLVAFIACGLFLAPGARAQHTRARSLSFDTERREWVEAPLPVPGTPEADVHSIRLLLGKEQYKAALSLAERVIKNRTEQSSVYPDLLIAKSEALIGLHEYYEAHLILQSFQSRFSGMKLAEEALRLEFVIAEVFLTGVKRKVVGFRLMSGEDLAFEILDEISDSHDDSPLAEAAIKTKADYRFKTGEHDLAEKEYARLLSDYPRSRFHEFCLRRSAEAALAVFGGVEYDESALVEAKERYEDYRRIYPGSSKRDGVDLVLGSIRELRAEKEFSIAAYYERSMHLKSAIHCYQLLCQSWPGTIAATKALSRLEFLGVPAAVESGSDQSGQG